MQKNYEVKDKVDYLPGDLTFSDLIRMADQQNIPLEERLINAFGQDTFDELCKPLTEEEKLDLAALLNINTQYQNQPQFQQAYLYEDKKKETK